MKKLQTMLFMILAAVMLLTAGCGTNTTQPGASGETPVEDAAPEQEKESQVASSDQMTTVEDVVDEDMVPIYGGSIKDGTYAIQVDSSSSMFSITECELTVRDGEMTAVMHMGGKGYLKVFMGTGEEAAAADEADCIPYEETAEGTHTFTVPVEALDMGISCAAFSKSKELWYDRTLVFRGDSLPMDAFQDGTFKTAAGMEDGDYTVEVQLAGGSGRASVESPAALRVENGTAYATVIWGSANYDYMRIGEEKFLPINTEGNSTFEIPVAAFDWKLTVYADTTAMSTPHEIEYTLRFDSATIEQAG